MRQYVAAKQQVPGTLLLFRLGDFYELFYEDAVTAARELEITLTSRNKERGEPIPMCGVPYHSADGYIARLIQKGYRVAICEQMEEPGPGKKLVRRELTRIVTPGTATDSNLLRSHENNFLAAVFPKNGRCGLAYADVSTGEFRTTELAEEELMPMLETLNTREVLRPEGLPLGCTCLETEIAPWVFGFEFSARQILENFRLLSLDGCGLTDKPLAVGAAGAVLHYLRETQKSALGHLNAPNFQERSQHMVLDNATIRNLELVEPLFAGESRETTLLHVLDQTATGMGGRLLRRRILQPSCSLPEIEQRLDSVAELAGKVIVREELRRALRSIQDLERLLAKATLGTATPRELLALGRSLAVLPKVAEITKQLDTSQLRNELELAEAARDRILSCIADEPPVSLADGGTIRPGFHPELDELRGLSQNSRQYIAAIEMRERSQTGIASLKVRFNNVFGYYIEISKANLAHVPPSYERKQTLANAERFTTPELKELEAKVLSAEEKILALERELFQEVRSFAASQAEPIKRAAAQVAELDVAACLAHVAVENRYHRPKFSDSGEMRIDAGRHPVIEKMLERNAARFVPNDLYLHSDSEYMALITGPNMGGKSTYLRQAALTLILAQTGSFVPADGAILPIVDRVYTRIGAADNLARGRSTFMVEMTETAAILNTATPNSFIVLDEIGRGTSTYDGLALAWAVVEYIQAHIHAKTLFATHYHELTELANQFPVIRNLHVSVKETSDQILFIRKIEPGAADRSYGIEVARLAGLPMQVIERARSVLLHHEVREHSVSEELAPSDASAPLQIRLFEPVNQGLADRIRALRIDELRPVEALQILHELQQELRET
ncbi:MAG TPA: DNA mismatch repair protein MutS [Bryobacteraceae bacterium]|jgi:DNA mismatch repair protein MutS|nr:DNA mismatch repair protein MutS [Bryobacteraceae bacterium]